MLPLLIALFAVELFLILLFIYLLVGLFRHDLKHGRWWAFIVLIPALLGGGTYGYYLYTAQPINQKSEYVAQAIAAIQSHDENLDDLRQKAEVLESPQWENSLDWLASLGASGITVTEGNAGGEFRINIDEAKNGSVSSTLYYEGEAVSVVKDATYDNSYYLPQEAWAQHYPLLGAE